MDLKISSSPTYQDCNEQAESFNDGTSEKLAKACEELYPDHFVADHYRLRATPGYLKTARAVWFVEYTWGHWLGFVREPEEQDVTPEIHI